MINLHPSKTAKTSALFLLAACCALLIAPLIRGLDVTSEIIISSTDDPDLQGAKLSGVNFLGNTGTIRVAGGSNLVFDSASGTSNRLIVTSGNAATFVLDEGATLTFSRNQTTGNTATNRPAGAAIHIETGGTLTLAAAPGAQYIFENNLNASQGAAIGASSNNSDGVYIDITNAIFRSNTTTLAGGNNASTVYNTGANSITKLNSVIFINNASSGASNPNGGAIGAATGNKLTVNGALFERNWAGNNGGAIWLGTGATATITSATFKGNYALGTTGGGAIFAHPSAILTLNDVRFEGNLANRTSGGNGGGAILAGGNPVTITATNVTFVTNTTTASGGAVAGNSQNASMTFTNASFQNNTASGANGGGAFYISGNSSTVSFTNATFLNNLASGANGGGAFSTNGNSVIISFTDSLLQGNYASTANGGAFGTNNANTLTLTLNNVLFASNSAATNGGALYLQFNSNAGNSTFTNASFLDNVAIGGQGGAIYATGGAAGGTQTGILNYNVTTSATIAGNKAGTASSGIYFSNTLSNYNATFSINSGATLDMLDPMGATVGSGYTVAISQTGAGVWNLGGANTFAPDSAASGTANFTVNTGTLHLIGAGKRTYKGNPVAAGSINIATAAGAFTLKSGATLFAGGGNAITAPTISLEQNAIITLDLAGAIVGGPAILSINATTPAGLNASNWLLNLNLLNVASLGTLTEGDTFSLITLTGGLFTNASLDAFTVDFGVLDPSLYSLKLGAGGTTLELYYGAVLVDNNVLAWTGLANTAWSGENWSLASSITTGTLYTKGDIITIADAPAAATTGAITVDAPANIAGMYVSGTTDYTLDGPAAITASATVGSFVGSAAAAGQLVLGAKSAADATAILTELDDPANAYTGTLTLANASNDFQGGIIIRSGALVGNAATLGSGTAGIENHGTLTFDQAADATYSATIRGDGAFIKTNTGALILAADNRNYTGTVDIALGSLLLADGAALGGAAIRVASAATLGGAGAAGSAAGTVTVDTGGALQIGLAGATSPQTLSILGNLTLADGSRLNYTDIANTLLVGGNITQTGASALHFTTVNTGSFSIIDITGGLTSLDSGLFSIYYKGALLTLGTDYLFTPDAGGNLLWLTILQMPLGLNNVLTWTNATTDNNWLASANWHVEGFADKPFVNGDIVNLAGAETTAPSTTITLDTPATTAGIYLSGAASYALEGAGSLTASATAGALADTPAATGKLVLGKIATDENTLTDAVFTGTLDLTGLAGPNRFDGVEINSGALRAASTEQLGTALSNLTLTGEGTLLVAGDMIFDGENGATQHLVIAGGTATIIAERGATFAIKNTNDASVSGTRGGGAIYVSDSTTLVLTGSNGGGFLFEGNTTDYRAGAIHVNGTNAVAFIDSATFINNTSGTIQTAGGALVISNGTLTVRDSVFRNNTTNPTITNGAGGALASLGTSAYLAATNVLFENNTANQGGVLLVGSRAIITSATFVGNTVTSSANGGGAAYNNSADSNINFTDVLFLRNAANTETGGGGAYMIHNSAINTITTFTNVSFLDNTTTGTGGGAIYVNAVNATITLAATGGATARLAGNTANDAPNSIFFNTGSSNGILNIATDAGSTVDMLDPIRTNLNAAYAGLAINKTGDGAWNLSGTSILSKQGQNGLPVSLTVSAGTLYLYGANDAPVYDALSGANYRPTAAAIVFQNGNAGANTNTWINFTVKRGATLSSGGGNTISVVEAGSNASLTLEQGSILDFSLGNVTPGASPMLTFLVSNTTTSVAGQVKLNLSTDGALNSLLSFTYDDLVTGSYNLLTTAGAGVTQLSITDFTSLIQNATYGGLNYSDFAATGYQVNAGLASNTLWVNFIEVALRNNGVITWTGAGTDASWLSPNWTLNGDSARFVKGDIVNLVSIPAATADTNITTSATVSGMYVSGSTSYTINGRSITAAPATGTNTLAAAPASTGKLILGAKARNDASAIDTAEFTGTLTLANTSNNFTRGIEINTGALVGNAATLGSGTIGITIAAPASLTFEQANNATYAAPITGAGALIKNGSGALTLAAASTALTGRAAVNAGALLLDNGATLGTVDVATSAIFGGNGAATGDVTLAANSTLQVGIGDAEGQTLSIAGDLALGNGATLNYSTPANQLLVGGTVNIAGTGTINFEAFLSGTFNLGNIAGLYGSLDITVAGAVQADDARQHGKLVQSGDDLLLTAVGDISRILYWTGSANTTWALTGSNWDNRQPGEPVNVFGSGDKVIFDDSGLDLAPAITIVPEGVTVSDMEVNTTGDYTITGGGIIADPNSVFTGTVLTVADATGKLTKNGAGTLTLATEANEFLGGIALNEGALILSTGTTTAAGVTTIAPAATLRMSAAGQLNTATLELAASSTLSGQGAIRFENLTITNGQAIAAIVATNTLSLSGNFTSGTLLKTGLGALQYTGTLTGNGATQVDEGSVSFSGFTRASSTLATHNIVLNGGNLILGTGSGVTIAESSARDWSGITITQGANAASSVVSGANDIVYIGAGTFAPALRNSLIVAVNAPGATTVLSNTSNNFAAWVRVDVGTLQVTNIAQLGTHSDALPKIALNGGAVQFSTSATLAGDIQLRSGTGTIAVDDGMTVNVGRIIRQNSTTPNGAILVKTGSGTLANNSTMQATGMVIAGGRYIALSNTASVPTGIVDVAKDAVFEYRTNDAAGTTLGRLGNTAVTPSISSTMNAAFTGEGTLEITTNSIILASANTNIANIKISGTATTVTVTSPRTFALGSAITVDQSTLVLGSDEVSAGNVTLNNGATMGFLMRGSAATGSFVPSGIPVRRATLASLAATGTGTPALWFNTDLARGYADHLTITSPVSGSFTIGITDYSPAALPEKLAARVELINATQGLAPGAAFTPLTPEIEIGLNKYNMETISSGDGVSVVITGTGAMSNSAGYINSMAAALPVSWLSELDSVTQRLGELRFEKRENRAGLAAWMRGYGEQLEFDDTITGSRFDERHLGIEAGVDYKFGGTRYNIYIGAFAGYGKNERDYTHSGEGGSESVFGGIYETLSTPSGWYVDGVLKVNGFKNHFTAISLAGETMKADYKNWAIGGSLEIGKHCDLPYGWFVTPQVQGAYLLTTDTTYETDNGMSVRLRPGTTARARAGFMFGRLIETGNWGILSAYVKGYAGRQWMTDGQIHVTTPNGGSRRYVPVIEGQILTGGAGLSWLFTRKTQVYLDVETTQADNYVKPYGLNFGIRHMW